MFIETERMRLRPFRPNDLEDLCRLRAQPEVMRYIGSGLPQTRLQVVRRLQTYLEHYAQYGFGVCAVIDKATGRLIGASGLFIVDRTPDVEIGFTLDRPYWGQGRATEIARACLEYGFATLRLPALAAVAYPENLASRRVLEKIGLEYYKTVPYQGVACDCYRLERSSETRPKAACGKKVSGIFRGKDHEGFNSR